jgi:heterodisulfide reductase subunit B
VFGALGLELAELADWNCCGATAAHSSDGQLADALVLRNLSLAEAAGVEDLVVPCAECYNLLKHADVKVRQHEPEIMAVNGSLPGGGGYTGTVNVTHPLQLLARPDLLAALRQEVVRPLTGLKAVTYYGCLLTRPQAVAFDRVGYPLTMDTVLAAVGAEVPKWSYKTDCCGASLSMPRPATVAKFVAHLVAMARRAGAQAISVACPLCHANLDTRQPPDSEAMPIFYFSELIGISLAHPDSRQWLARHLVDPLPLLVRHNLL